MNKMYIIVRSPLTHVDARNVGPPGMLSIILRLANHRGKDEEAICLS